MAPSLALIVSLITLSCCYGQYSYNRYNSYDSYGASSNSYNRDQTDRYGTYHYDRLGYRVYSRCQDSYSKPRDQCRDYRGRGDYGYGSSSYDSYNSRYGYGERKVNVGRGTFRIMTGRRDAELTCEFPRGSHLVSNIVWERVRDNNYGSSRYNSLRGYLGRRMEVERIGDHGSALIIRDFEDRDSGIYRCVGTRSYDDYGSSYSSSYGSSNGRYNSYGRGSGRTESVYMEVEFYPESGYSGAFNGRDYYPSSSGYRPSYGYRTAGVTSSEDTIVPDKMTDEDKAKKAA